MRGPLTTTLAANRHPKVIRTRLVSHATLAETMDSYRHLFPDAQDLGRAAVDVLFGMVLTEHRYSLS